MCSGQTDWPVCQKIQVWWCEHRVNIFPTLYSLDKLSSHAKLHGQNVDGMFLPTGKNVCPSWFLGGKDVSIVKDHTRKISCGQNITPPLSLGSNKND
jgi:hypothetical protein